MDAFQELFNRKNHLLIKPGLARIIEACELLNHPQAEIPAVIIGGTNGKGSTCGFLFQLLSALDIKPALYSSPHLVHYRERFYMGENKIDDRAITFALAEIEHKLSKLLYDNLSFFELSTLLSFLLFKKFNSQFNIFEVGMGGRWDATNIVDAACSAITSIGLDHEAYLGNTLSAIAKEKSGIIKAQKPLFLGDIKDTGALKEIEAAAEKRQAAVFSFGKDYGLMSENLFFIKLPDQPALNLPLPESLLALPPCLRQNFVIATSLCYWLTKHVLKMADPQTLLANVIKDYQLNKNPLPPTLRGRFQRKSITHHDKTYEIIFDVCHNPDGVKQLSQTLQKNYHGKHPGLVSVLADKNINLMVAELKQCLDPIIFFQIPYERTFKNFQLAEEFKSLPFFGSFEQAWQYATDKFDCHKQPWIICGSVIAVGRCMDYFIISE